MTYEDIHKSEDNLWNFLFFTGDLRMTGKRLEEDTTYLTMSIPNMEIRYIYRNTIQEWFREKVKRADFTGFYKALIEGDGETVGEFLSGHHSGNQTDRKVQPDGSRLRGRAGTDRKQAL